MKANRKIKLVCLVIIGLMIASANNSFSQDEYDDMYFTPKDRKEVKFNEDIVKSSVTSGSSENKSVSKNATVSDVINPTYSPSEYGDLEENYSAKNVNPEYIARYKSNPKESTGDETLEEGDSYYDDYYDRAVMPGETKETSGQKKYSYPSSYYGGYNAMMRTRMHGYPWYDPFMGAGYGPAMSFGLGYTFGYMPGFSMGFGYGSGYGYNPYGMYDPWGYGYSPYMSRFYDPFYSPWAYDPFYSPWRYNSWYSSMRYGYGGYPYYCSYPSYGFGSGYSVTYITTSGSNVSKTGTESNRLESPSYRNRISRGSDRITRESQEGSNARIVNSRRNEVSETQSVANARTASDRDFSRSQNEYYSRSRNTTSAVSSTTINRNAISNTSSSSRIAKGNTNTARVRSSRINTDYSRPSYQTTRQQRAISSGSSGRNSWSNSGTYRSSRSSGSSYSPSRSSGSSYSSGSGSRIGSSSGGSISTGSYSSGGSRSSGSSSGGSRSNRGN
jgi:hypothetical protein